MIDTPKVIEKYLVRDEIIERQFNLQNRTAYASTRRLFIKKGNTVLDKRMVIPQRFIRGKGRKYLMSDDTNNVVYLSDWKLAKQMTNSELAKRVVRIAENIKKIEKLMKQLREVE